MYSISQNFLKWYIIYHKITIFIINLIKNYKRDRFRVVPDEYELRYLKFKHKLIFGKNAFFLQIKLLCIVYHKNI